MGTKPQVLFLCTGNSARSQMAEAFLKRYAGTYFDVQSAGLEPKGINPYTIKVMAEVGYDMSGHRSKSLREFMGQSTSRYVITVCGNADVNCPRGLWSFGEKLHWPFEDPATYAGNEEEILALFRHTRDQIKQQILAWLKELDLQPEYNG
jgi:arsenate reductase (thioredoxin)